MQRNFTLSFLGLAITFSLSLNAQQTVVLPARSTGGPAVITNYATTGPGLPTSSLFESRLAQPVGVPTVSAPGGSRPAPLYIPGEAASLPANRPLLDEGLDAGFTTPRGYQDGFAPRGYQNGFAPRGYQDGFNPRAYRDSFTSRSLGFGAPGELGAIPDRQRVCRNGSSAPGSFDGPHYTFPGLVTRFAGNWVGSEYLYNVSPNIGVVVDVVAPDKFPMLIDRERIHDVVSNTFACGNINTEAVHFADFSALPFFHILIFIQNAEEGSVAFVAGRLFENVRLARLDYPLPGTMQAITWEQQDLLVDSINRIEGQIITSAQNIAQSFVDRLDYFMRQKLEQEEMLRLRCTNFDMRTPSAGATGVVPVQPRPAGAAVGPAGRLGGAPKALSAGSSLTK